MFHKNVSIFPKKINFVPKHAIFHKKCFDNRSFDVSKWLPFFTKKINFSLKNGFDMKSLAFDQMSIFDEY